MWVQHDLTSCIRLSECVSGCGSEVVRGWFGVVLQPDRGLIDLSNCWRSRTDRDRGAIGVSI